jgi:hypothetical protein
LRDSDAHANSDADGDCDSYRYSYCHCHCHCYCYCYCNTNRYRNAYGNSHSPAQDYTDAKAASHTAAKTIEIFAKRKFQVLRGYGDAPRCCCGNRGASSFYDANL